MRSTNNKTDSILSTDDVRIKFLGKATSNYWLRLRFVYRFKVENPITSIADF